MTVVYRAGRGIAGRARAWTSGRASTRVARARFVRQLGFIRCRATQSSTIDASATIAAVDRSDCRLPALDRELDRNIVPGSVRVRADFLVRLAGESLELGLRERRVLDVQRVLAFS